MNISTIGQLLNHDKPTVYYDTESNNIKLSTVPILTMFGNNSVDIPLTNSLYNKPKTSLNIKTNNKTYYTNKNKEKNVNKKVKKNIELPDELRCCANTNDGNRCSLRRYTQKNEELCFIHYKQQLKSIIKDNQIVSIEQEHVHIPKTNKWYSWFTKRLFSRK